MNKSIRPSIYTIIIAVSSLLITSFLWRYPLLLTGILLILGTLMILIYKDINDLYLFIVAGILGAFAEVIAVLFGAWNYTIPSSVGVPYWLPLLWGMAALFLKRLSLQIDHFRR